MKHSKAFIALLSIFVLAGCNNPIESKSIKPSSSDSSSTSSSDSSAPTILPPIDISKVNNPYNHSQSFNFTLEEFGETVFNVAGSTERKGFDLIFDNEVIVEGVNIGYIFGADINKDGYREIVATGDRGNSIVIYDVHNSKHLHNKNTKYELIPGLANPMYEYIVYGYYYEIMNDHLVLVICNGMANRKIFDYATINYSVESGVTFQLQNMYDIDHMTLKSFKEGETEVAPNTVEGKQVYSLKKGVKYTFDFEIIRKENADLSKVLTAISSDENNFPLDGIYIALGDKLAPETIVNCISSPRKTNYFGTYTFELTLPEDVEERSFLKIAYCDLEIIINFVVE